MQTKAFWDITYKCNGRCLYCFTNSGEKFRDILTLDEMKKIADMLINKGISKISFGGGEPFLCPSFLELCRYIGKKAEISVTTNGTVLNDNIYNLLQNSNINLTISIDTLDAQTYEGIRQGIKLSNVLNNIMVLVQNVKIRERLSIRSTITPQNMGNMLELLQFCVANQIKKLKVNSTNSFGRAKEHSELIPDFTEFMDRLDILEKEANNYKGVIEVELPIRKYLGTNGQICTLGKNSIYIDPYGNVFPCAFSEGELLIGNLLLTDIDVILDSLLNFSYNDEVCKSCLINRYDK